MEDFGMDEAGLGNKLLKVGKRGSGGRKRENNLSSATSNLFFFKQKTAYEIGQ